MSIKINSNKTKLNIKNIMSYMCENFYPYNNVSLLLFSNLILTLNSAITDRLLFAQV